MEIFPKPSGPFSVGTVVKHCIDTERSERYSSEKNPRELLIQIWYPAKTVNSQPKTFYAQDVMSEWTDGLAQSGFPVEHIEELKNLTTYAQENVPLCQSKKPYPLLLFCHGYVALRSAYTAYCQELASHGFIVVGIAYTYYTQITKLPDGKTIYALPEHSSQIKLTNEIESQAEQTLWLEDTEFILDTLQTLNENKNPENIFYHAIDFNNVGIFGHSFGGSTALQMCRHDERIKAAVDLDGGLFGDHATEPIGKPIMIIVGQNSFESYQQHDDAEIAQETGFSKEIIATLRKKYFEYIPRLVKASPNASFIMIKDAKHAAFSDWAFLKHLPLYHENKQIFDLEQQTGNIDGSETTRCINNLLVNFFDQYLKS